MNPGKCRRVTVSVMNIEPKMLVKEIVRVGGKKEFFILKFKIKFDILADFLSFR